MTRPLGVCIDCGGPKPSGMGRRWCDSCITRHRAKKNPKPCMGCGGPKEPGRGRRWCAECTGSNPITGLLPRDYRHAASLRRRYGMTIDQYNAMHEAQGGVCAVCGRTPKKATLCVDHDHETGEVRGLLCHRCNAIVDLWATYRSEIEAYLAGPYPLLSEAG